MNIEEFREYCLQKPFTTEETPFGPEVLVFKVHGKMFTATDINSFESINLKCDPEEAIILREKYASVLPGYHMNKKHWNTVLINGQVSDKLINTWIDKSYELVIASVPLNARVDSKTNNK